VDPKRESYYNERGWDFGKNPEVPFASLQVVEDAQVRGITDRADPATIARYAEAMKAGAVFPPGLVAEVKVGDKLVTTIVDWHHRMLASIRLGRTTGPAYILKGVDPATLKLEALSLNRHHGKMLSDSETLAAVADLLEAGMSVERIVQVTGLSRSKIDRAHHALKFRQRVETMDVLDSPEDSRLTRLGQTARANLSRYLTHDPVFAETTKLVLDAGLTGTEAIGLAKRVASAKSDEEAIDLVRVERELRADVIQQLMIGVDPAIAASRTQFRMHAGALLGLKPEYVVDHNPVTRVSSAKLAFSLLEFAQQLVRAYTSEGASNGEAAVAA
jgi:hypothetical protein